ncbi:MAG: hypothetical protein ACLFQC_06825 [Wenzhouxiangella sp.]
MDTEYGTAPADLRVRGEFVHLDAERYYAIRHVDALPPFFISVVSSDDHWLFASSTGGLTAGRVSPDTALFPYLPVDRIHECSLHTGSRTLLRIHDEHGPLLWEPYNNEQFDRYRVTRNLYKNTLGDKLCFEEINHDLELSFRYTWMTSPQYGFVRACELVNYSTRERQIEILDGLLNLLPADTPLATQTGASNLVDAYKWTELDLQTGLGIMSLYSAISDRAEPAESLKATTVCCVGLDPSCILLSATQIEAFRRGRALQAEHHKRGIRAAYLVNTRLALSSGARQHWQIIADTQQSQKDVVALRRVLQAPEKFARAVTADVAQGSDRLARVLASSDGFQASAVETVDVHHCANVLFNVLRGGVFHDQYHIVTADFAATLRHFNRRVHDRHRNRLDQLPQRLDLEALRAAVSDCEDLQLARLAGEYLPITFGRRHGDPSRPWNHFAIRLKDEDGNPRLSYAGNWRDIFQNWEALALSFPEFIESMVAKFVNASTVDGYNPYRIMKDGIDWEVEEADDPWSYIGYWGDHQIIYLQKLLEISNRFHPRKLGQLLRQPRFCYANVPYRIKPFAALLDNPKSTVIFDEQLAGEIDRRVAAIGADGKLVLNDDHQVYQVNLAEKLLVPLLAKLGNLVIDGGIWLNTQRPEWNDANNALVGHGLSMVTLYYMRRYVAFLDQLIADEHDPFPLSLEVARWLTDTAAALAELREQTASTRTDARTRYQALAALGEAASRYRASVYGQGGFSGQQDQPVEDIRAMLADVLDVIDRCIAGNRRKDGLFNAYNLMQVNGERIEIRELYPMLEGQVAVLSSGAIGPADAVGVIEALFDSAVYRPDQCTFMLYPDRQLPSFLEKNRISEAQVTALPFIGQMLEAGDERIVLRDADHVCRFSAEFRNADDLHAAIDKLVADYGDRAEAARQPLAALYEKVFNHTAFTGRSGTMFGFEGLGSVYWHMVAKLLLAVQENFFHALKIGDHDAGRRLGELYYRIRAGLGFNKTPAQYGAFPTDPYSHTPGHGGAQQPGMTGQVKEEIITRFGELGVRVEDGRARFDPALLRPCEFSRRPRTFRYLDVTGDWQAIDLPGGSLAFTWCQVPIVYRLDDTRPASLTVQRRDGSRQARPDPALDAEISAELFGRNGTISRLELSFPRNMLFAETSG